MKYRTLGSTDLKLSEVGFGVWTVATNWWGRIDNDLRRKLLRDAVDLGINFFDTADAYSDGFGEEILAEALGSRRQDIVIGTKFGYDIYNKIERVGHRERVQRFDPEFVRFACEQSLRRLGTDYIDLYQVHNPKMEHLEEDELFETLDQLAREGKVRYWGVAIGPDIGWYEEGEFSMRERSTPAAQIIYSILEQQPARDFFEVSRETEAGLLSRVPHASGLLDGSFTKDTVFDPEDHRNHRKAEWLEEGLKKLEAIEFLTADGDATIGQTALKFVLSEPLIASVLPNITSAEELNEFGSAPDTADIPDEHLAQFYDLFDAGFELEPVAEPASG